MGYPAVLKPIPKSRCSAREAASKVSHKAAVGKNDTSEVLKAVGDGANENATGEGSQDELECGDYP